MAPYMRKTIQVCVAEVRSFILSKVKGTFLDLTFSLKLSELKISITKPPTSIISVSKEYFKPFEKWRKLFLEAGMPLKSRNNKAAKRWGGLTRRNQMEYWKFPGDVFKGASATKEKSLFLQSWSELIGWRDQVFSSFHLAKKQEETKNKIPWEANHACMRSFAWKFVEWL